MTKKVKMKTVIGHPEDVITTLTDLIIKGEVNVVLFCEYGQFSPDELEEKLSKKINLNTGWETDYFSWGLKNMGLEKSGLKFNKVGDVKIEDQDVMSFIGKEDNTLYFLNGLDSKICDGVYDFVSDTLPELFYEGLTKEDVLGEDYVLDFVNWMIENYLDEEIQEFFKFYEEREDWTLMDYTYDVMYESMESGYDEYVEYKSEC